MFAAKSAMAVATRPACTPSACSPLRTALESSGIIPGSFGHLGSSGITSGSDGAGAAASLPVGGSSSQRRGLARTIRQAECQLQSGPSDPFVRGPRRGHACSGCYVPITSAGQLLMKTSIWKEISSDGTPDFVPFM
eukprot:TRINITY_DN50475_c0_g1_i1.p2 TRINITY_DN50475_c0_g1~~TRINITY_DN50475_c0_g1_i1.p2  ORF type:complete len:152 (-),score=22.85 TRINITY_DN50475_c0_g1_i1:166-573(-)